MNKGSNSILFFCMKSRLLGKIAGFRRIITVSTGLAISNMSSFVPKYYLNWQIMVAILKEFLSKDGTTIKI